jgi:hypothetical protein
MPWTETWEQTTTLHVIRTCDLAFDKPISEFA